VGRELSRARYLEPGARRAQAGQEQSPNDMPRASSGEVARDMVWDAVFMEQ